MSFIVFRTATLSLLEIWQFLKIPRILSVFSFSFNVSFIALPTFFTVTCTVLVSTRQLVVVESHDYFARVFWEFLRRLRAPCDCHGESLA